MRVVLYDVDKVSIGQMQAGAQTAAAVQMRDAEPPLLVQACKTAKQTQGLSLASQDYIGAQPAVLLLLFLVLWQLGLHAAVGMHSGGACNAAKTEATLLLAALLCPALIAATLHPVPNCCRRRSGIHAE